MPGFYIVHTFASRFVAQPPRSLPSSPSFPLPPSPRAPLLNTPCSLLDLAPRALQVTFTERSHGKGGGGKSAVARVWDLVLFAFLAYFALSIINNTARDQLRWEYEQTVKARQKNASAPTSGSGSSSRHAPATSKNA